MALLLGANLSMFFLVVQYVQGVLGFGPLMAGVAFLPFSLGIFAHLAGHPGLLGRFGPRPMMLVGTGTLGLAYAWLSTIGTGDTYLAAVFGPMALAGISSALTFMPVTVIVLSGVERSTRARPPACSRRPSSSAAPSASASSSRCTPPARCRASSSQAWQPALHLGHVRGPGAGGHRAGDPHPSARGRDRGSDQAAPRRLVEAVAAEAA